MSDSMMCMVEVGAELWTGGQMQVRVELSDGNMLQLIRGDVDLARMMKRLVDGFPDDRETLSCSLLPGLLAVKAAEQSPDPEIKVLELNRLLKTIINLPQKFSQSEAVLDFFQPCAVDPTAEQEQEVQTIIQEEVQEFTQEELQTIVEEEIQTIIQAEEQKEIQEEEEEEDEEEEVQSITQDKPELVLQNPVTSSEVLMSNGFCLANTETIMYDLTPTAQTLTQPDDPTGRRASVGTDVCLQFCHPSASPQLLRGFTGIVGKLAKRRTSRRRAAPPP